MCINRPLYQCEGAVFFSSEMRKVRASVNSDFSEALHPDSRTLYPESGNIRRWLGKRNRGTGYGLQRGGSSSSPAEVLFPELRVITLITKKYSILKTTTTTDYHILDLPLSSESPPKSRRSIFFSAPYYIQTNPPKKPHPHRWRVSPFNHSLFRDPPKAIHPSPFLIRGCCLGG